jgi:hypothetical protein
MATKASRKAFPATIAVLIAALSVGLTRGAVQTAAAADDCVGVDIPSGGSIARAAESHPAGTTFCLTGRYQLSSPVSPREAQSFRGPAEIVGVNGNDTGFHVTSKNVHFFDLDMSGFEERAIRCMYGTKIFGGRYHHNGVNGIGCGLGRSTGGGVIIGGIEADHNGSAAMIGHSSAAIKLAGSPGSVVRNSYVHDNVGNGIWFDVDSGSDMLDIVARNDVAGNSLRGVFYEVSRGHVIIRGNTVTGNNTSNTPGASGIGVSSSKNVTIWGNTVQDNFVWAIRANQIDRGYRLENVRIYDNVVDGVLYGCEYVGVDCVGAE